MTRKIIALPSQKELRDRFVYDPKTGVFRWRRSAGTARSGEEAGWVHKSGYVYVGLNGRSFKAHRLAWMYVYGKDPQGLLDHIDRNKANNRIHNLRVVSDSQSNQNKKAYRNNTSGYKGVGWYAKNKKWRVRIQHERRIILVGFFDTVEEALAARQCAEKRYHTHAVKNN